ncbi:hypothetical protein AGMMS49546_05290 [Spirochaetia bacterium]|nr:hypothetical protein AGMMS49546_05290 [Spirochaetia bacterium]
MDRELIKADVAIFGGGPGGIAAAVAAAREGVKVVLVERMGFLGGGLASGLPFLAFLDMHKRRIVGGLANEMVERLATMGGEAVSWPDGSAEGTAGHRYCPMHVSDTTVNQFYTRILCFQWAKDLGIQLLMHCEPVGAVVEKGKIKQVTIVGKGKAFDIDAKVFIDATGDGDLGYLAGASYEKGAEGTGILQPPTLMFNLSGVDFDRFIDYLEEHPGEPAQNTPDGFNHIQSGYDAKFLRNNPGHIFVGLEETIQRLRKEGKCPVDRDTIIYIRQPIPGTVAVNTIRIRNFDGSDVHDLSRGEQEAHLQILPLIQMFKKNIPGFENCYMTSIHPVISVRESRRIMGIKKLTKEDALSAHVPDDSVAIFSYFIDIHIGNTDKTFTKTVEEPYGVPYGCTVSKDIDGLMMAGRCMSADSYAHGSSRIMTLCMAVGEGAGVGAALAVKQNISPKDVDPAEVRKILLQHGAILS